ncbi:MAG: hypothetical protein AAF514_15575, partial [Verrucomicrobiota bacterium]
PAEDLDKTIPVKTLPARKDIPSSRLRFDFEGADVRTDPELGILYNKRPADADNLSLLESVDAGTHEKLNKLGIYQFRQIGNLTDRNITALENRDPAFKRINWKFWRSRIQSQGGKLTSGAVGLSAKKMPAIKKVSPLEVIPPLKEPEAPKEPEVPKGPEIPSHFKGEDMEFSSKYGWIYRKKPTTSDDFTKLHGLTMGATGLLGGLGIYKYRQLAHLKDEEIGQIQSKDSSLKELDWKYWRTRFKQSGGKLDIPPALAKEPISVSSKYGYLYSQPPATKDDLTRLQGISAPMASALNKRGLYRYGQIAHLTDAEISAWESDGPEYKRFPWRHWRDHFKGTNGKLSLPAGFESEPIAVSPDLGAVYPTKPATSDDFTRLKGIGTAAAGALAGLGIYKYRQVGPWGKEQIDHVAGQNSELKGVEWNHWRDRFKASNGKLEIPADFEGEKVQVCPRHGIIYPSRPSQTDDFTLLKGMTADRASTLNGAGIHNFKQARHWSDGELSRVTSLDPGLKEVEWNHWRNRFQKSGPRLEVPAAFKGEAIQFCPRYGIVYPGRPSDADDLSLFQGVTPDGAAFLNKLGIYKFKQIAHWKDSEIQTLVTEHPEVKSVPWNRWRQYFKTRQDGLHIPPAFASEKVQFSPDFGIVYPEAPAVPDQLDLIDGVSPGTERRLNELGIYKFKQVSHLTDSQISSLRNSSTEFRKVGWNLWRAHFNIQGEARPTSLARIRRSVPLEFALQDQTYVDPNLGTLYRHPPADRDTLSKIEGIDSAMEKELNRRGIYTFRQLAFMNDSQLARLRQEDARFKGLGATVGKWKISSIRSLGYRQSGRRFLGDLWRWRSFRSPDGELLESHPAWGSIFKSRPSFVDNLTRLEGIDADGAARLNQMGIYQFAQISQMTFENVAALGRHDSQFLRLDPGRFRLQAASFLGSAKPARPAGRNRWRHWKRTFSVFF